MTRERATQLLELYRWKHFGCLLSNGIKPDIAPETVLERQEVIDLWDTMPGYTCYNDALTRIAKGDKENN